MIRQIKVGEVDLIDPIMTKFGQESDIALPPNFVERIKSSVKDGKTFLYGAFTENNKLEGIGAFGSISKRMSFVYSRGNSELDLQLIDTIFRNHSACNSYLGAAGPWVSAAISNRLVEHGFRKLDRAYMTLDRNSIIALERPVLTGNMEIELYDSSQINELSELIFKGNDGHIDQIVFPNFFGTTELCKELIENIENNVYGEYKKPYSWLLRENNKLVGACLMTIRNRGDTGYIPDIVIDPEYQGRGLGKAILIHSMKELLSGESDIAKIGLDVTLENNARFLYQSLGYETVNEYSMYTWLNKKND